MHNTPDQKLKNYYKWHAKVYDLTRWSFLGGRTKLIRKINQKLQHLNNAHVLEIGCGTGYLLKKLAENNPNAHFTGVDLSQHMLQKAEKSLSACSNVQLVCDSILKLHSFNHYDIIYASYSLTMMQPILGEVARKMHSLLKTDGKLFIVDFHKSNMVWFESWMKKNHVFFPENHRNYLQPYFKIEEQSEYQMYAHLWQYALLSASKTS